MIKSSLKSDKTNQPDFLKMKPGGESIENEFETF